MLLNYLVNSGFRRFLATAVVIMSRLHPPGAVPPVEQAAIAADLSRWPMSHKKAIVRTEVEQFDGVTKPGSRERRTVKAWWIGGANGSRVGAPDDKLRVTYQLHLLR